MKIITIGEMMKQVKQAVEGIKEYEILDYFSISDGLSSKPLTISKEEEWVFFAEINFGGSEGIYLDCFLRKRGTPDARQEKPLRIACLKTLSEDRDACLAMGTLYGAMYYQVDSFLQERSSAIYRVPSNDNDREWTDYSVEQARKMLKKDMCPSETSLKNLKDMKKDCTDTSLCVKCRASAMCEIRALYGE